MYLNSKQLYSFFHNLIVSLSFLRLASSKRIIALSLNLSNKNGIAGYLAFLPSFIGGPSIINKSMDSILSKDDISYHLKLFCFFKGL